MKLDVRSPETRFGRSKSRDISLRAQEIVLPIRRKQAARSRYPAQSGNTKDLEVAVADYEYNESTFPFRQRTNSSTSIDTIRTQSTATKLKNDTSVVAPQKSVPRNCSPTSLKQDSKQTSSFQSTTTQSKSTSSLSLSTANAKAPRKKRLKKSDNGPVPKPLPTIFNVGRTSLLSGLALPSTTISTTTTTTNHFLDDIFAWNMDTLPSISNPPPSHSPVTRNNTPTTASLNTSYSAPSDAPFSTPYDEDALFENEIPFPFNKHSGVIIENMGVKKAKNLNKGKGSLLNRHITTAGPYLSGPTLPLSLPSLNRNTTNLDPQPDIPHTTTPRIPVAPFSSTEDAWRCIHVGPADCELSIAFPETSHFEVWDMDDDEAFFACPLFLCLMANDPHRWTGTPIALPDFSLIDIRCDDLPVPSSMSVYDPSIEYAVQCTVPWNRSLPPPYSSSKKPGSPFTVDHKEITIEGKWERTYTKPKMEGQTPIFHITDRNGDADGTRNARGWYLKIWIPIPARLFMKRETRIFEVRASVWMTRAEEHVLNMMDSEKEEEEEDFPLIAEAEMTVSHLRREREMMMM